MLGVNSLVTQNTQLIGRSTIYGQSLLLAYAIYGLWILTVVIMISINQSKKRQSRKKWYILHQRTIFRYLRLGGWCALIIYIPLLSAYSIDEDNGEQSRKTWAWYLLLVGFILVFSLQAFVDYRLAKKRRCDAEEDSVKVQGLLNKPLKEWDEDDVILWINKAKMYRESYFTEAKRHLIEDKLKEAGIDGELLCKYGSDMEKLVNYVGLSVGDAEKVTKELTFLKREDDSMSTSKGEDSMMEVESALVVKGKDEA